MNRNNLGTDVVDAGAWQEAVRLPAFRELIDAKKRLLVPMTLIYFLVFIGTTLLAGYAKPFMTTKVVGSFNVAYLLVVGIYVMCWVMAMIYVKVANRDFDRLAAKAIEQRAAMKAIA